MPFFVLREALDVHLGTSDCLPEEWIASSVCFPFSCEYAHVDTLTDSVISHYLTGSLTSCSFKLGPLWVNYFTNMALTLMSALC